MVKEIEPYKGIAAVYEESRPGYPDELIEDIISGTGILPGDRLLEIGAGTGKATMPFAERGFALHAIELGEDMAAILRKKCAQYKNVTVEVLPFEQWPGKDRYDMIYCAQAFHWLDPALKYVKCHQLLKDDGYLALFWYSPWRDHSAEADEIQSRIDRIKRKYVSIYVVKNENAQRRTHDGVSEEDQRLKEIEESGLFTLVEKTEYLQEGRATAEQYLKQMKSVPAFASILDSLDKLTAANLDDDIRAVINEYGGYIRSFLKFTLYIAKKR
jgi:SAM-dependent methyltransferase